MTFQRYWEVLQLRGMLIVTVRYICITRHKNNVLPLSYPASPLLAVETMQTYCYITVSFAKSSTPKAPTRSKLPASRQPMKVMVSPAPCPL